MDNHKPKSRSLFDSKKERKEAFKYASTAHGKSKEKHQEDVMTGASHDYSCKTIWHNIRKSKAKS